ncbi:MAG TPA: hypothetical protein VJ867_09625 [Gemmatimonadaceae bacterium]|nr:hypothetical protein [Gemmatimonadaceae bacterium]
MNVLYFTSPASDYLADSVLHGLRSLMGPTVVDYPRADVLYADGAALKTKAHGRGFTLYGLLQDEGVDRYDVLDKVRAGFFDLIVISSIHRQFGWLVQLLPWLTHRNTIVLDGEDGPEPFPYAGSYWRRAGHRRLPRAHTRFLYFKRELTPATLSYRWFKMVPAIVGRRMRLPRNVRPIAFAIPAEKIVASPPAKSKDFPRHIVDPEVAAAVGASTAHVFDDERAYYRDLQCSRWGITTKRSGWDCIRHYEIAANGAVPCFRSLDEKPDTCAPHGLGATNSVLYHSWPELQSRIARIDADRYAELQQGSLAWARANTTVERARQMVDEWRRSTR